jgi:hypothetical protein
MKVLKLGEVSKRSNPMIFKADKYRNDICITILNKQEIVKAKRYKQISAEFADNFRRLPFKIWFLNMKQEILG